MTRTPLRLSGPLFSWDKSSADEHVSFDELHQRIVHFQTGGFSTVDVVDGSSTPDGLFVKLEQPGLRVVRFSPDGLYFAFLCDKKRMGCVETLQPHREPVALSFKWNRSDVEVLDFFWLPPLDLAVVTNHGIEVFRLSFEQHSAKSQKAFPASVRTCWVDALSGMVLIGTGPRTLQPFDLRSKSPKMPKFDLVLQGRSQVIEDGEVSIMSIYDATYCIHADSTNGHVSLRNISQVSQGTPEHDIVIDVGAQESFRGTLRLSKVDNLLIVHCVERTVSMIFDIKHKQGSTLACMGGPAPMACAVGGGAQGSWDGWEFLGGSTIVDSSSGVVYRLKVDMGTVLEDFVAGSLHDLSTVTQLLLRRTNCRGHIVSTLSQALRSKATFNEWAQGFAVLNQAYRQTIEALSQKATSNVQGRPATLSLQELEAFISHQSILSEKDMVSQVFYPHFLENVGEAAARGIQQRAEEIAAASETADVYDQWRVPLPAQSEKSPTGSGSRPLRSPYLLSVVIAYLRSLLSMQILPHKVLQCFVFDISMYFEQEHTLQQLLHYHVLLDSPELVLRLKEVSISRGCPWATQACLDMALRIHKFPVVADMLLHTRQYLDIVPFLINQQEPCFKMSRLLERIDADIEAQTEDPDLLDHVLAEIRMWQREAIEGRDQIQPPDLENCEKWFPELAASASAAGEQRS